MADLQGPKIRIGKFADGQDRSSSRGRRFVLDAECEARRRESRRPRLQELPQDVAPGAVLLLDDGLIRLEVESVEGPRIITRVDARRHAVEQQGHQPAWAAGSRRPALTAKDMDDVKTAAQLAGRLPRRVVSRRARKTCTWRASCCAPRAATRC